MRAIAFAAAKRTRSGEARMADIVNLRQARKSKARRDKAKDADANRAAHGREKSEKALTKAREEKAARDLDAHKIDQERNSSDS
jgi:hypothetical protein